MWRPGPGPIIYILYHPLPSRLEQSPLIEDLTVSFEKLGRPAKDPAEERLRIYTAALPVIREKGARASMTALAEAAHMSVGGLYHYFNSKRSLLLHGINPEAISLACHTFHQAVAEAESVDKVVSAYIDKTVLMFRLIQPSAMAAVEMGIDEIRGPLQACTRQDADGLIEALESVTDELTEESLVELATTIRATATRRSFTTRSSGRCWDECCDGAAWRGARTQVGHASAFPHRG
jgi:AcrR family transcriptional regulator